MNSLLASIGTAIFILILFWLDREKRIKNSHALWIPTLWLLVVGSRPITVWFNIQPMDRSGTPVGTESSAVDAAFYSFLILCALVVLVRRSSALLPLLRKNLPLILFFAYCLLSVMWADFPFVALKRWVKTIGEFVMVLVVLTDRFPEQAIKRFFTRTAFLLIPLSILFIKYYPDKGTTINVWTYEPTFNGVSENKNMLGMLCLVSGINSVWCFANAFFDLQMKTRMRNMAAHLFLLLMVVWLLKIANSVTSFSCFALAGTIVAILSIKATRNRTVVAHALVGSAILLATFALFFDSGGSMVQSLGRNSTLTGRTSIWAAVLSVHSNPIIGAGFENFWTGDRMVKVWEKTAVGIQEAHNGYLEVYLNLGFAGIAALAFAIARGYQSILREYRLGWHCGRLRIGLFAAGLIYSLSEAGFRQLSVIWIAFMLSLTVVPQFQRRKNETGLPAAAPVRRAPTGIL